MHAFWLRAEPFWIDVPPDRDDDGGRKLAKAGEHASEEIAGLLIEDRSEREVDDGVSNGWDNQAGVIPAGARPASGRIEIAFPGSGNAGSRKLGGNGETTT